MEHKHKSSLMSPGHIAKQSYDEAKRASRVVLADGLNTQISLNSKEDSISTSCEQTLAEGTTTISEFDVSGMRYITVYKKDEGGASPKNRLEVSPTKSGDTWFEISMIDSAISTSKISGCRARIISDSAVEGVTDGIAKLWVVCNG